MPPPIIYENFETLASAPNGIEKLRELILQLAVQGKLVPQDPKDESAAKLLERIRKEKEKLIAEGKIKKQKPLLEISEDEIPFELPKGWEWVRLVEICSKTGAGSTPLGGRSVYVDDGIPFLRSQNVWNDGVRLAGVANITRDIHERMNGTHVDMGDILINITGASIARCAVFTEITKEANVSQHVAIIRLIDKKANQFVHKTLISPYIYNEIMNIQVGISREGLSMGRLQQFIIPIPPLAEQKRIVEKVDRLMALCDELEERRNKKIACRTKLNESCLHKLLNPKDPKRFAVHWNRIRDNFDLLYDNAGNVKKLRQAILQLAVQGKLVPQDPEYEPASKLLVRIRKEKEKLIAEGKIRPQEQIANNIEDLLTIPKEWKYCYFDDIAANEHNALKAGPFGSSLTKSMYAAAGFKIYGQEQVIPSNPYIGDYYINESKFRELSACKVKPDDILISLVGTIGKVLILPPDCEPGIINPRLIKISLYKTINRKYIRLYLKSPPAKKLMKDNSHGGTMEILNLKILRSMPIPLPPILEQNKIVEQVEKLMVLCDELEEKLNRGEESSRKLLDAVVAKLAG